MRKSAIFLCMIISASEAYSDEMCYIKFDSELLKNSCIYESKVYTEGSVRKNSDGKEYQCVMVEARLVWKELLRVNK